VTSRSGAVLHDVDPFDLPDWLATGPVVWESDGGLRASHHVTGTVTGEGGEQLPCALLAVDEAYPAPVVPDDVRTRAHQAWRHGQVLLVERTATLTLAVPGRRFDADLVLEAIARLAKAVGAPPDDWAVLLRLGTARR
jgi:hypothetical protein